MLGASFGQLKRSHLDRCIFPIKWHLRTISKSKMQPWGLKNGSPAGGASPLKSFLNSVIVLETSPQSQPIYQFHFPDAFTLVIGNEEYGCSENSIQLADALVEIPMAGRKNSLNVANAYAIAASEIHRQKRPSSHLSMACTINRIYS